MLSLCHTLKEVKAFQNQAEGPLVFLLTFWAMYFLMVLYTFLANLAFHLIFGNQGATTSWQKYIFAATTPRKED